MASKYTYTTIPEDAFNKLAVNAGILVDSFDPSTRKIGNQIGATTGGVTITCKPEIKDMGSDVDNCPKNTMELATIDSWECKLSGTMVTIDVSTLQMFVGAGDTSGTKITPRMRLETADFKTLWYICDYGDGGFVAVELMNALSTAGVSIKSTDKDKANFDFEFTGYTSLDDQDTVPMAFYVDDAAAA
jgi:hypothetical protein